MAACGCDDMLDPPTDTSAEVRVPPPPPPPAPPARPPAAQEEPETALSPDTVEDPAGDEDLAGNEDGATEEDVTVVEIDDLGARPLTPQEAQAEIEKQGGRVSTDETDSLMKVFLNRTSIGDEQMSVVQYLPHVQVLILTGTSVGDEGLKHVHGLAKLERIYAAHTNITEEGVRELKQVLPDCEIYR
jgi:hypothetical protein